MQNSHRTQPLIQNSTSGGVQDYIEHQNGAVSQDQQPKNKRNNSTDFACSVLQEQINQSFTSHVTPPDFYQEPLLTGQDDKLVGVAAQNYDTLKPILRNNPSRDSNASQQLKAQLNVPLQTINATTPMMAVHLPSKHRRTKSASKASKGANNQNRRGGNAFLAATQMSLKQQYQQMQPVVASSEQRERPLTGKLHPRDFSSELNKMGSAPAFHGKMTNSRAGSRNSKFQNTQQIPKTRSDMMLHKELRRGGSKLTTTTAPTGHLASNVTTSAMNSMGLNIGMPSRSNTVMGTGPPVSSMGDNKADFFSIKHVTPELAAQVVKHFVLPMFDTDYKKGLRRKYGRMQATNIQVAGTAQRAIQSQLENGGGGRAIEAGIPGTVLGDLKLTEHLSNELEVVRNKFDSMNEALEKATLEREVYKKRFIQINNRWVDMKKEVDSLRTALEHQIKVNMGLEMKLEQREVQSEQLISTSLVSEQMRKRFCDKLKTQQAKNEALDNQLFNLDYEQQISNYSIQFLQGQFTMLHDAVYNISADKRHGDKMERKIQLLTEKGAQSASELNVIKEQITRLVQERDQFRLDTQELHKNKKIIEKQYAHDKISSKDREVNLQKQLAQANKENNEHLDEVLALQKTSKQLYMDKEKSKLRIQKLIQRKGKFDSGMQTCKQCSREYNEKENFKWSCRTHYGQYSGEMWWCCGKFGKDQLGCRYSAHESKDEDEDEENQEANDGDHKNDKYVRCACCKEIGHSIDDCTRDPNIKTGAKAELEFERIQRMKDFRKLFADSIVQTTHMLKKAIKIPIKYDDEDNLIEVHAYTPFMRGIMEFDDYNYALHNPYVLIEDPKHAEVNPTTIIKPGTDMVVSSPKNTADGLGDTTFSQKNLTNSVTEDYEHPMVTVELSEMQIEKRKLAYAAAQAEEEIMRQKALEEKLKKKKSKISSMSSDMEEEKTQLEGDEDALSQQSGRDEPDDAPSEDDEYSYRVFFRKDEIKTAREKQGADQFAVLMRMKQKATNESLRHLVKSKINILDFSPEKFSEPPPPSKKALRLMARQKTNSMMAAGTLASLAESEDDIPISEEIAAEMEKKRLERESKINEAKLHEMEKHNLEEEIKTLVMTKLDQGCLSSSQNSTDRSNIRHKRVRKDLKKK